MSRRFARSRPGAIAALLSFAPSALAGCSRDHAKPAPDRTAVLPASTVDNVPPRPSGEQPPPVEQRAPLLTREAERQSLSLVALRPVEFALGQQRSASFEVWTFADTGGGAKLVVTQGGFTFTQPKPDYRSPLILETKTITGGPIAAAHQILRLEGMWPDRLFARARFESFPGARQFSSSADDFERTDGKWSKVKALPAAIAVADGAVFALNLGKISTLHGAPVAMPAQSKPPEGSACVDEATHLHPRTVAGSSGGGLLLVGQACRRGPFGVERFPRAKTSGVVELLPEAPNNDAGAPATFLASVGSADNMVVGISTRLGQYLAVARGGPFRKVTLPSAGRLLQVVATADGAVFVLVSPDGRGAPLLFRLTEQTWTPFALPNGVGEASADTLFAADRQTAIVGGSLSGGEGTHAAALFATFAAPILGKPAEVGDLLQLDKWKAPAPVVASAREAGADPPLFPVFQEGCKAPFVYVFDVSKSAPADFLFPSTKRALAGFPGQEHVKLVEFTHQGKRRLGAHVSDASVGQGLVAHITAKMKDEKPVLVCFTPSAARAITLP